MKLKMLGLAILSTHLVACASQPIKGSNSNLSQKVYTSYEHLVGKQSYAFDGRAKIQINGVEASQSSTVDVQENVRQQKILLPHVVPTEKLSSEQIKWMNEGFEHAQNNGAVAQANQMSRFIQTLTGRFFYDYTGVVDLSRGQISLDSKFGYEARNAQGWLKVPVALDFKQDKVYADLSAFSPFLTDPKHDGRYIEFDLKNLIREAGVNKKPLLEVMRDYMLVNAALAKDSDYQRIALTDVDKQRKIAEHIRYTVSYEELMAQYALYFYLNQNYLKTILNKSVDQGEAAAIDLTNPLKILNSMEQLQGKQQNNTVATSMPLTVENRALLAKERLADALQLASDHLEAEIEAEGLKEEARLNAEMAEAVLDESEAETSKSADDSLVGLLSTQVAGNESLAKFDFYQSHDQLVSAQSLKKIIAEQPEAYQQLIASVRGNYKELGFPLDQPLIIDMGFDQQGRLMRSEMAMDFSMGEGYAKDLKLVMDMNFYDYGKARIDENVFKNAIKWSETVNENTLVGTKKLGKDNKKIDASNVESKAWTNQQRYQHLAKSLMAQGMPFIDAYTLVYRYAYMLEGDSGDLSNDQTELEQLNNTGRWNAIYFAQENGLAVTPTQAQEYEDSPEDWYYYDEELSDEIWTEFYKIISDQEYTKLYQSLRSKYKDDAALFSAIYYARDEAIEKKRNDLEEIEYPEGFDKFVKTIGQIAVEDMKTEKVNQAKIDQLDLREISWFEEEIYQKTYAEFLKHRK